MIIIWVAICGNVNLGDSGLSRFKLHQFKISKMSVESLEPELLDPSKEITIVIHLILQKSGKLQRESRTCQFKLEHSDCARFSR